MKSIRYLWALLIFAAFAGGALGQPPPGLAASAADVAELRKQFEALQQAVTVLGQGQPVGAEGTVQALQEQLSALEQKVRVLEREKEIDKEAAAEKAKTTPVVTAKAKDDFQIKCACNKVSRKGCVWGM